ncbi:MAG: hypothetical protein ACW98K_11695 [Candidatus Kariarchaeaceae archaeon]|jgi:hypothetical protein
MIHMPEMTSDTKTQAYYQLRSRDIAVTIWISFLILLSIDSAVSQWLPSFVSGIRLPLICFLLLVPSRSAFQLTGIRELLVVFFSAVSISLHLILSYITNETPFIPPNAYDDGILSILSYIIMLSLIIPWIWFGYRRFKAKFIGWLFVLTTSTVLCIAMLTQFDGDSAYSFYFFAIGFMSFWLVIASAQVKMFYYSRKNRIGNILMFFAFFILGLTFSMVALDRNSTTEALAQIGVDLWIYSLYIVIALLTEGLIITEAQTLSTVRTYNQVKAKETTECIVFTNIDTYLKEIPEELIRSVDDDDLMLAWIGLQRT